MPVAIVTGASRGLGAALARVLDQHGWSVVADARDSTVLDHALGDTGARLVPGDVTDPGHRDELVAAATELGGADLLVNNASTLGASPMPRLADLDTDVLDDTLFTNVVAPHALTRELLPQLVTRHGIVLNLSSDAAVEAYEGWGAYSASKAALDHLGRILAAEHPGLRVYAVDPGDMRTQMHQDAFPDEDISDRPEPESVVPRLISLLTSGLPSGRYRASDVRAPEAVR